MKPRLSNDRKAPRMKKGKYSTSIVCEKLWREFKKKHGFITWEDFYTMWEDIAETIRYETIYNPLGVKLGGFMGELKCQYLSYPMKNTDQKSSDEVGENVNYVGLVTKGKAVKLKWERRWAVKFNKMLQFYAFKPTREIGQIANKYIEKNPDKLRVSRNTLGGFSIWRQLKNNDK